MNKPFDCDCNDIELFFNLIKGNWVAGLGIEFVAMISKLGKKKKKKLVISVYLKGQGWLSSGCGTHTHTHRERGGLRGSALGLGMARGQMDRTWSTA